ncbi:MAG: DUF2169 domain-containing protein [Ferruginibacter sp.]
MDLINNTPYPAFLFRTALQDDILAASVSIRVTYSIEANKAIINDSQHWELHHEDWETGYGPMRSDNIYKRGGVDIFVFGSAKLPNNDAFTQMQVTVNVANKLSNQISVFGDRHWELSLLGGLSKSRITPVKEVPLTLSNAFGGCAEWDGLKLPYGNNPLGKGYYWEKENAINKPLPNIENPANLIVKWNDQPDPVGTAGCPMGVLHLRDNLEYNKDTQQVTKIDTKIFNAAFPGMIINEILPGEKIIVEGMTSAKNFVMEIPDHDLFAAIKLGDKVTERPLKIDQVGIIPDKNEAFITYRFPFRYAFEAMQLRSVEVYEKN